MAIESPEGSDPRSEDVPLGAALRRRLPRIVLVTAVLVAATYLLLPFIPAGREVGPVAIAADSAPLPVADPDLSATSDAQLADLQQRVTDADSKAANFEIANNLSGADGTSLLDQQVAAAANAIAAAQARRDAAQSNATLIRGLLDAGQPLDSVADIRDSVAIQQLEQQRGQITAQRAQLLATFLPNHPGVVTATAQIAAIDKQIAVEARRVADALDAQARIEGTGLDALQQTLDGLKAKQVAETRNAVALDALKRDATASRAQLQGYLTRYSAPAISSTSTQNAAATAGVAPAAPLAAKAPRNTILILAAVALLALAVQIGAICILALLPGRSVDRRSSPVDHEPYRHSEERDGEADDLAAPFPAADGEGSELLTASATGNQGLRRWFTRHAHVAGQPADEPILGDAPQAEAPQSIATEPEAGLPPAAAVEPEPDQPAGGDASIAEARALANLSADLILGRASIVVLASIGEPQDSEILAERLASDALEHGMSVAHVDAGSQRVSTEPGITDLAAGLVGFGDVVFKVAEGLAEIPWGQLASLDPASENPGMLVEALSEVYEVVLVAAGTIGADDGLRLFARLNARLVLVGSAGAAQLEACRAEAQRLGFRQIEVLATPTWHAEVA